MKRTAFLLVLMLVSPLVAQKKDAKKEQKPDVHSDFQFGAYPTTRAAFELMSQETARLLMVAYSKGWQPDKVVKTYKQLSVQELNKMSDKLEDERFLRR